MSPFCLIRCFLPSTWKSTGTFCCCSVPKLYPTLCNPMVCIMLGFPVLHYSWSLLRLMLIESMLPSTHLILCHPLLLLPFVEIKNWWLSELRFLSFGLFPNYLFCLCRTPVSLNLPWFTAHIHFCCNFLQDTVLLMLHLRIFTKNQHTCFRTSLMRMTRWLAERFWLGSWDRRKNFSKKKLGANINPS